jgi:hypothetical protein
MYTTTRNIVGGTQWHSYDMQGLWARGQLIPHSRKPLHQEGLPFRHLGVTVVLILRSHWAVKARPRCFAAHQGQSRSVVDSRD